MRTLASSTSIKCCNKETWHDHDEPGRWRHTEGFSIRVLPEDYNKHWLWSIYSSDHKWIDHPFIAHGLRYSEEEAKECAEEALKLTREYYSAIRRLGGKTSWR